MYLINYLLVPSLAMDGVAVERAEVGAVGAYMVHMVALWLLLQCLVIFASHYSSFLLCTRYS